MLEKPAAPSRRDEILSIAASLFGRYGYHQTTMQQIADAVGMRKGSLYHHYRSKQEILFEVTRGSLGDLVDEVRLVAESSSPPPEKVRRAIYVHLRALERTYPHLMVVTAETDESLPEGIRSSILALRRDYQLLWRRMIEEGFGDATLVSTAPSGVVVNLVLGSINWMHRWYRPNGQLRPDELAKALSDMVLAGIEPRRP